MRQRRGSKPKARYNWATGLWFERGSNQRQLRCCPRCIDPMFSRDEGRLCMPCQRQVASERHAVQREALRGLGLLAPPRTRPDPVTYKQAQRRAMALVARAKATGALPRLDGAIQCVDCKCKPATVYEHRDYARPLEVEPVCHNCNLRRGAAFWSVPTEPTAAQK